MVYLLASIQLQTEDPREFNILYIHVPLSLCFVQFTLNTERGYIAMDINGSSNSAEDL
jgi:hypothetical protein